MANPSSVCDVDKTTFASEKNEAMLESVSTFEISKEESSKESHL